MILLLCNISIIFISIGNFLLSRRIDKLEENFFDLKRMCYEFKIQIELIKNRGV